jgi:predicted transposase/invertase (TIGR01784 family)
MPKLKYPLTLDIAFKLVMTKDEVLLKSLVASVLSLDEDAIESLVVTNPELGPEHVEGKHCRLDLRMDVDGATVDVELQVRDEGNYRNRSVYYLCRLCAEALAKGQGYREVPRTVLISILGFDLFDCEGFHSEFFLRERSRGEVLSDKLSMHFLELQKLEDVPGKPDMLGLWMRLIRADTTEELDAIRDLEVDVMSRAVEAVQEVQEDRRLRHLALRREMAEHDEAQALGNAERRGEKRGIELGEKRALDSVAFQMHAAGFDAPSISKATGYTEQQVASLLGQGRG